ncbi:MAG: GNAT family N-acetyltransferase [Bacteroidales bacterium]|nr:GNAT family N-acetyltransferase [Bacteroidales bacterium]
MAGSKNATFLFYRDYMDYHADRFCDHSLLFYEKDRLLGLLPGNVEADTYYSHQGLTYGGFLLNSAARAEQVIEMLELLIEYLKDQGIKSMIYKSIPWFYHKIPAEEDLYALYLKKAVLISRSLSSTIHCGKALPFAHARKDGLRKARKAGLSWQESKDLDVFWPILEQNLWARHHLKPVHSLDEIWRLQQAFPQNIRLFLVTEAGTALAGSLVYETETTAHIQYISSNQRAKALGALDLLFEHLIYEQFKQKDYLDFGISTDDDGYKLDRGLLFQKEGFGARASVYDIYALTIA